jgi:integrase
MNGHIEKRYKSSWTVVIRLDPDPLTGERKRLSRSVKGKRADAERVMAEMLHQLQTGTFVENDSLTVGEFLEKWLSVYCKPNLAPKTLQSYRCQIRNHLGPKLGRIPLTKLTPLHLQDLYNQELERGRTDGTGGLSPRTVIYHHRIIREALSHAVKWQLVMRNVADAVDPPRQVKKKIAVIHGEELTQFLNNCRDSQDYLLILTAVSTGMRQGEILGLRWTDVDFSSGVIHVRQQQQYLIGQGFIYKPPKSERSQRQIPLPRQLVAVFKKIKKEQATFRLQYGKDYIDTGLVFTQPNGQHLDGARLSNRFKRLAVKFGHPELRWHDTRHIFAAVALASGVSMERLQALLGHESITTTIDTYGHLSPTTLKDAMDQISSMLKF